VIRLDRRVEADTAAWEKQKDQQRAELLQQQRRQRIQEFMAALRDNAKIEDNRKQIEQQNRQAAS
jgi:hypothetical protein